MERAQLSLLPSYEAVMDTTEYRDFNIESVSVLNQLGVSINNIVRNPVSYRTVKNEHFDTPKPVDPFYTGREDHGKRLCGWLLPKLSQKQRDTSIAQAEQKRFIVYGVGGARKTQFCSKFAQDNRHWSVRHASSLL